MINDNYRCVQQAEDYDLVIDIWPPSAVSALGGLMEYEAFREKGPETSENSARPKVILNLRFLRENSKNSWLFN